MPVTRAAPNASAADCSMFLRSMGIGEDMTPASSAFMLRPQVLPLVAVLLEVEDIVSRPDGTTKPLAASWSDRAVAIAIVSFMMLQVLYAGLPCSVWGLLRNLCCVVAEGSISQGRALCKQTNKIYPFLYSLPAIRNPRFKITKENMADTPKRTPGYSSGKRRLYASIAYSC